MFSERNRYILKLMAYLATLEPGSYETMAELSEKLGIPRGYLNRIIPELVEMGYVNSKKGKGGGVRLARGADEITMLSLLDDIGAMQHRTEETYEACCIPEDFNQCMIENWMDEFRESVIGDVTLQEVSTQLQRAG